MNEFIPNNHIKQITPHKIYSKSWIKSSIIKVTFFQRTIIEILVK